MARVVVIGGGWAGTGAALAARMAGAEVTVLERAVSGFASKIPAYKVVLLVTGRP